MFVLPDSPEMKAFIDRRQLLVSCVDSLEVELNPKGVILDASGYNSDFVLESKLESYKVPYRELEIQKLQSLLAQSKHITRIRLHVRKQEVPYLAVEVELSKEMLETFDSLITKEA